MRVYDICELLARDFRDPISSSTLAIGSIAATVIGAGIGIMGQMQQANSQSNAMKYNAEVAANNQVEADQAAVVAQQQGAVQQQQKAYQEDVLIGQQKAGLAANGVDVGSGTAVDLLSDTKAAGELDQLTIVNNAQREAMGFKNQSINYSNQAQLDEASSAATLEGGNLKAAATFATSAGQVANQWYNYSQKIGSPAFSSSPQAGGIV